MATSRSYEDPCGIARALDIVGDRWALLVVRELMLGPKRFSDLRAGLGKLSANVLGQRLRDLEDRGVVSRRTLPPPGAAKVYELTDRGRALEPVLLALGDWGRHEPFPAGAGPLGADAFVLALRTVFDATSSADLDIELRLGAETFRVRAQDGALETVRVEPGTARDAAIETDTGTLAGFLWRGGPLPDEAIVAGTRAAAERLPALFAP